MLRALLMLLAAFWTPVAAAADAYSWTQATVDGAEARAVVEGDVCPSLVVDGLAFKMQVRAGKNEAFPVTTCALLLPKGAKSATLAGRPIPLIPAQVEKILLLGDTGCRIAALQAQDCDSMRSWPFRLVADLAAEQAPDLVVHLGDVIYRERACPPTAKCGGSPFGENFWTWKADWFEPAKALLEAAPLVFVRGNHEDCSRNGLGWTRFLSPLPFLEGCNPQEPPITLDLGNLSLAVLDVTRAEDRFADEASAPFFRAQFAALAGDRPLWIAMHKPIYAIARVKAGVVEGENKTLAAATEGRLPSNVEVALSGHMHMFEALSYARDFPAQIVAGMGGTLLDRQAPATAEGLRVGEMALAQGVTVTGRFGFATLERQETGWLLQDFGAHGETLARCRLSGRKLDCR